MDSHPNSERAPSGFPRELRLRSSLTIRTVLDKGRRAAGERVLVVTLPNTTGHLRFASVVGRKVSKRAHERNLLRRRLREAFRLRRAEIEDAASGWDLVVLPLRREGKIDFARLSEDLVRTTLRARRGGTRGGRRSG